MAKLANPTYRIMILCYKKSFLEIMFNMDTAASKLYEAYPR